MVAAFQSADRAATYKYLLDSPPDLRRYASMWFFFYGVASVILLATSAVAAGFVVLWSFVDVAQGCTPGSIFFAIAIQQAVAFVNREIAGQTMRFIVDDYASAGQQGLVKRATDLFSKRAAELGLMNHTGKRKLVRSRATVAALEDAGYEMNGIGIVDGTVFAGQLIVDPLSAGGQRFIEDFYDAKVGALRHSVGRLRSLTRRQDAFGILSSCFYFNAPQTLDMAQLDRLCARRDSIVRDALAWLVDESELLPCSWQIAGLPLRHRGGGIDVGSDRVLASAVTLRSIDARVSPWSQIQHTTVQFVSGALSW